MTDQQEPEVNADRITVGMKVMGGILVHAVMLVIFFMSLKSTGDNNAEAIKRNSERISQNESDNKIKFASVDAQLAAINVQLAVLQNQMATKQQK